MRDENKTLLVQAQEGSKNAMDQLIKKFLGAIKGASTNYYNMKESTILEIEDVHLMVHAMMHEWLLKIDPSSKYSLYTLLNNKMKYYLSNEFRKFTRNKRRISYYLMEEKGYEHFADERSCVKKDFFIKELIDKVKLTAIEKTIASEIIVTGLSYTCVASKYNKSEKSVKTAYFRAISKLKRHYNP